MQNLDTQIAKLTKEKKNAEESNRQLSDQLQAEEDKVNHLNKVKQKLEANLDEVYYTVSVNHYLQVTSNSSDELFLIYKVLD